MKKIVTILSVIAFTVAIMATLALALKTGETSVQIPIGTKVEKKGDITRFILADGVLEVVGTKGELLIKAYDSKGKLLYSGKQGRISIGKAKTPRTIEKIREKVAIDDDVVYIRFNPEPAAR